MPVSQNGYPANNEDLVRRARIAGTDVDVRVRRGAAGDLLLWAAARWHREVELLRAPDGVLDCWGYAPRAIRGGTELSNHASGTALDFRARIHPLGASGTYRPAQVEAIRRILADARRALRWGGDYRGRKDEMHLEVVADEATCARVLADVMSARLLRKGDRGRDVHALQEALRRRFPDLVGWAPSTELFGDLTDRAVRAAQRRLGLAVDGVVGPATRKALGL